MTHIETFAVEDKCLVRRVIPRRGEPYEHRCPLAAYRELAWAAIDMASDGYTMEILADYVRDLPPEGHDAPWASYTNAAVASAFWKDRGLVEIRRRRRHVDANTFFEDAMIEYHALEEA